MRSQKPCKGKPRKRLSPSVLEEIEWKVKQEAERYDVSKSFVISVALAKVFGIKKQELY